MLAEHKKDARLAAHGYSALFRGETTPSALAAGVRLHTFVEHMIAFVQAHRSK